MKIFIGCKHYQTVAGAQLASQGIDRVDLNAMAATLASQFRSLDMIAAVRYDQRQRAEPIEVSSHSSWPRSSSRRFC